MKKYIAFLFVLGLCWKTTRAQGNRPCRNVDISQVSATNVRATFDTFETNSEIRINLRVTWDVINPNDFAFDGFLIRIFDPLQLSDPKIKPTDQCIAETSDGFWINSNTCSNPVSPLCPPGMDSNLNGTCLCSSDCSMLGDFACRGTPYYLTSNGGSFSSLRSDARSFSIPAKFHIFYQVEIWPYYRQFPNINFRPVSFGADDCHEVIMKSKNVSLEEAASLCCDFDVPHFRPLFFHITEAVADDATDTANVTITWYPPIFEANMVSFNPLIQVNIFTIDSGVPKLGTVIAVPTFSDAPQALQVPCYNATYVYQVVVSNVLFDKSYTLAVQSRYPLETGERFCIDNPSSCQSVFEFNSTDVSRCIGRPIPCNTPVLATTTAETDATNNVNTPEIDTTATTNLVRITSAMETSTQPDGCPITPSSNRAPILFNVFSIFPDFSSSSVNVTLSWFPPIVSSEESSVSFSVTSVSISDLENGTETRIHNETVQTVDSALQCFGFLQSLEISLSNFSINVDYLVRVTSIFPPTLLNTCVIEEKLCESKITLRLQDFNLCDDLYNPCAEKDKCRRSSNNGIISYTCNAASSINQSSFISFAAVQAFLFLFMQFT